MGGTKFRPEELRDIAETDPTDIIDEPRRTTIVAAHEAMHRMYGWHGTSVADQNLMKGHYSLASAEFLADRNIQHNLAPTFEQFKFLQSRKRPD